jgi:hypothetical protein
MARNSYWFIVSYPGTYLDYFSFCVSHRKPMRNTKDNIRISSYELRPRKVGKKFCEVVLGKEGSGWMDDCWFAVVALPLVNWSREGSGWRVGRTAAALVSVVTAVLSWLFWVGSSGAGFPA